MTCELVHNIKIKEPVTIPVGEFLKVGMAGLKPYLFRHGREVKGMDMLLLQLLSKKLNFNFNTSFATSFDIVVKMVRFKFDAYVLN